MGNRNGPADDQCNIERIEKLVASYANVSALFDVISDAVVAAKHGRCHQAHQLFRLLVESAVFIRLRVKREEALDAEVIAAE